MAYTMITSRSTMLTAAFDRLDRGAMGIAATALAANLQLGDCIVLAGPLAAGKTTFVQALAKALGEVDEITSPTFTLAHFHTNGRLPLLHIDAYRLESSHSFKDLALDDFYETHVTAIEWGEKFINFLPEFYRVELVPDGEDTRRLIVSAPAQKDENLKKISRALGR